MYVTKVKALAIEALHAAFDAEYPVLEWRGLHASLEYPIQSVDLPEVWVRYTDTGPVQQSGVAHVENRHPETGERVKEMTRYRFQGSWEFIVVAMTSLERDRLYDELVATIAWSGFDTKRGRFRQHLIGNDWIDLTIRTDQIESTGESAAPGTPWGTDEVLYERTLNIDLIGDFIPDPETGELVLLSKIIYTPTADISPLEDEKAGFDVWH